MTKPTTIKTLSPNGWPIRIVQYERDESFYIEEYETEEEGYGQWAEGDGYDTLEAATAAFDARCAELAKVPNRAMQARYDEEHGTDNGYAPFNYAREE